MVPNLRRWNHVYAGFRWSQTQEQVIPLISSSPLTEGVLISEMRLKCFCYRRMALNSTLWYIFFFTTTLSFISLLILLLSVYLSLPSVYLSLTHSHPPCTVIFTSLCPFLSFFSLLAIPSCWSASLVFILHVNNTWPLKLWMHRENKIPGLGCFSVCSPPGTLTAERNTEWPLITHTLSQCYKQVTHVYAKTHMQNFMYALHVHVCETRMRTSQCAAWLRYSFIFLRIMGHHHLSSCLR